LVKQYEADIAAGMDAMTVVSASDAELLREIAPTARISVVPNGVDIERFDQAVPSLPEVDLLFIGALNYHPNADGIAFLRNEILPIVWAKRPETRLRIVGRSPSERVKALASDSRIEVHGDVFDTRPFFHASKLVLVPLRIGGGTRIKILEAGACRRAVVSTSVGAEGLNLTSGRHLLEANNAADFASEILRSLDDSALRARLGSQLRETVEASYSWSASLERMDPVVSSVVGMAEATL
jgi:glycosyltransferase involved in cell wall biosynthesis